MIDELEAAVVAAVLEAHAGGARNAELIAAASAIDPLDGDAGRARVRRILHNAEIYKTGRMMLGAGIVQEFPSLVIAEAVYVH